MAYILTRFGALTLPARMTVEDISPVEPIDTIIMTAAGAYDNAGSDRTKQKFPHAINMKALCLEADDNTFRATIDALRAMVGTKGFLYRTAENDSTVQKALCKLIAMPYQRELVNRRHMPLTFTWQQLGPWRGATHGTGWELDTGIDLDDARTLDETPPITIDTNPKTITVTNGGNLPVSEIRFVITAGSVDITLVHLSIGDSTNSLSWRGTLLAGNALVIDSGEFSVLNAGSNAYNGLALRPDRTTESWAELPPGNTAIGVALVGGSTDSTIAIIFNDGWA